MKAIVPSSSSIPSLSNGLRTSALVVALFLVPVLANATDATAGDRAAQTLATGGSVPVMTAGPYVEVGTFRIQVSVKLGQPTDKLADGTWLYRNYAVDGSDATGTLIVRFVGGRVSQLSLVSPKVETAMRANAAKGKALVAAK